MPSSSSIPRLSDCWNADPDHATLIPRGPKLDMQPIFVKGQISFVVNGNTITLPNQALSAFGCTGLPWGAFNAREHAGKMISVTIQVATPGQPLVFKFPAIVLKESTVLGDHMGMKFLMDDDQRTELLAHIAQHGFYPTEYLRKYPRIPSDPLIQTFPLRAKVSSERAEGELTQAVVNPSVLMEVENLSPNGLLISSDSQVSHRFRPGQRIQITLEARGWFPHQIIVVGTICRISEHIDPTTHNTTRRMGVKFSKVDEVNRTAFLTLLQDILETLKHKAPVSLATRK